MDRLRVLCHRFIPVVEVLICLYCGLPIQFVSLILDLLRLLVLNIPRPVVRYLMFILYPYRLALWMLRERRLPCH